MKKYLIAALLSLGLSGAALAADISGVWESKESSATLSPGKMKFAKDGTAELAPEGFEPLKGTYKADKKFIDITIADKGKATLAYHLEGDKMTVQYENGTVQKFNKVSVPEPKKDKKK